jgi:hypothetical protein
MTRTLSKKLPLSRERLALVGGGGGQFHSLGIGMVAEVIAPAPQPPRIVDWGEVEVNTDHYK